MLQKVKAINDQVVVEQFPLRLNAAWSINEADDRVNK